MTVNRSPCGKDDIDHYDGGVVRTIIMSSVELKVVQRRSAIITMTGVMRTTVMSRGCMIVS